jgi:hypothetical protein
MGLMLLASFIGLLAAVAAIRLTKVVSDRA